MGRRPAIAAIAAFVVVAAVVLPLAFAGGDHRHHPVESSRVPPPATTATATTATPDPGYHPTYVSVPPQQGTDAFAASLPIAALETELPPAGIYTTLFPPVPAADTTNAVAYAIAFTTELLDLDYRRQIPTAVAEWTQAESAALMMPGIPTSAAKNVLYTSLFDPAISGQPSPIPSARQWASNAAAGVTQRVSDVFASEDPGWEQLVAAGFQSADPLTTAIDVTGVLTIIGHGQTKTERFEFGLGLGSALHHPGYGASTVGGWQVRG
jgi:hypothetical protein